MHTMYGVSSLQLDQEACARLCRWTGKARFGQSEIGESCEDEIPERRDKVHVLSLIRKRKRGVGRLGGLN